MRISIVLGLALLVAACGGSSMPPAPSKAFERTVNGLCPSNPQQLKGTTPAGGACQDAPECAPACCSCSNGSPNNWLAVSCSNGKCDTAAAACFVTKDDAVLCV